MRLVRSTTFVFILAALCSAPLFAQIPIRVEDKDLIPNEVYAGRRATLREQHLSPRQVLLVQGADVRNRQNDVDFEFRQNSNLLYLTGYTYPGAALMISRDGVRIGERLVHDVLFVKERVPMREQFEGAIPGPTEAYDMFGVDTTLPYDQLTTMLDSALQNCDTLFLGSLPTKQLMVAPAGKAIYAEAEIRSALRKKHDSLIVTSTYRGLTRMREVKDTAELRLLQRAIDITVDAHLEAMRGARPGMHEYEIEALIEYGFKKRGAEDVGYPSIVGSKYNACVLHYTANRRASSTGDLILADCGAEYHGYTADVTRTFPVNGRFTDDQRAIYRLVLQAQQAGIDSAKAGAPFRAPHTAAFAVIADGLQRLGIIDSTKDASRYFMHGTSHYLGLDVHDPGTGGPLVPNSVITVEPGIYIPEGSPCDKRWWNIGVRIEDDILITQEGPVNLSGRLPREPAEIEALMQVR